MRIYTRYYAYHRRATIRGNGFAFGGCGVGTFVDRGTVGSCLLASAYGFGGLIEFGGHVEIVDGGRSTRTDQGVGEAEVDVAEERRMRKSANISFFSPGTHLRRVSGGTEPKGFGIDTTLVSEEERITLAVGVDAHVEFGV